jgi:hypothetical protein
VRVLLATSSDSEESFTGQFEPAVGAFTHKVGGLCLEGEIHEAEQQAKKDTNVGLGLIILMIVAGLFLFIPAIILGLEPPG